MITAAVGVWQTYQQLQSDNQLAQQQHEADQQLAREQHQSDQQLARDQQRATILQTYIDNMRSLLLTPSLAKSAPSDEIRQVARVQTLTTLGSLDADRNRIVLRFLHQAGLIGTQDAVINLSNANLSNYDLAGADLSGADMNGATLTGAQLSGADLSGATLYGASLSGAHLSGANLSNAFMFNARLNGADLTGATMRDATLTGAFLGGADMRHAALTGARLNGAIMTGVRLDDAHLSGTDMISADLTGTDLSGADLSDADLTAAGLTQRQLDTSGSCTYATLAKGLTCHHNVTITLTYWYTESSAEMPVIGALIAQFERRYPEIHINAVNKNYFQTEPAFVNAAEEDAAPDILRSDVGWVAQFASQGYLLDIDPYIQGGLSDYLPTPLKYDYYRGHYYGLPQVTDFLALLYNKAELKKANINSPPLTMADFEKDAKGIVRERAAAYGFETDGTGYNALPFLYAFGGGMFDRHGNIVVSSNGSVNGLEFLLRLQDADKVMPPDVNFSNSPISTVVNDFASGETAMIFGGPYNVPQILTGSAFTSNPGNLGIARIPACPPGTSTCHAGQTGSPLGGQSYVISAATTHPIEAYKFISFMSSKDSQAAIAEMNGTLPTRMSAYEKVVTRERFISEFRLIASTAVARPPIPQAGHLFDVFDPNIAAVLDGVQSPVSALKAVAGAWKQLLAGS